MIESRFSNNEIAKELEISLEKVEEIVTAYFDMLHEDYLDYMAERQYESEAISPEQFGGY